MSDSPIVAKRRLLLQAEISARGLAVVAKVCQKPDRQILDMVKGRKSFGDGIARTIGPLLRPDLHPSWLILADAAATLDHGSQNPSGPAESPVGADAVTYADDPNPPVAFQANEPSARKKRIMAAIGDLNDDEEEALLSLLEAFSKHQKSGHSQASMNNSSAAGWGMEFGGKTLQKKTK